MAQLRVTSDAITDSGICHLIKNSPKLKTFVTNDKHTNETTIKAFIEKAINNEKFDYKLIARVHFRRKSFLKERITNNSILKNLLIRKLI